MRQTEVRTSDLDREGRRAIAGEPLSTPAPQPVTVAVGDVATNDERLSNSIWPIGSAFVG